MTSGHRTQCAELLGISRKVLWEKLREHELDGRSVDADASDEEREGST